MGGKVNPLLAKYEAKAKAEAKAEYEAKLSIHDEIDLIALLESVHLDLGVGPGRAERVLNGFLESKMNIAEAIIQETSEDDQGDFWVTQRNIAAELKSILGPEAWDRCRTLFPTLKFYWDRD